MGQDEREIAKPIKPQIKIIQHKWCDVEEL